MELFKQNYEAVVKRGLITTSTTDNQFLRKLYEEMAEVYNEVPPLGSGNEFLNEELADVITVCCNWLIHRGEDPEKWLKFVLEKNQKRANKS